RLLQPQHSREQGRRLHDVPRPGRSHAADVAGAVAADGMVPRLSSQSGALRAPARGGLPRGLRRAARSGRARKTAGRRIQDSATHELFNVSPIERNTRQGSGPFWRTLEERADDPAFQQHLYNEFPSQIEAITDPVARRTFLKLMGASLGLAGVTACTRQPAEKIVPYVRQPEELIPGRPLFFATAMAIGGVAT